MRRPFLCVLSFFTFCFLVAGCANVQKTAHFDAQVATDCGVKPVCYTRLQAALDRATGSPYRIHLNAGQYNEKITINHSNIEIVGDGANSTVIFNDLVAADAGRYHRNNWGTPGSATLTITAQNITLKNITIKNTFDYLTNDAKSKTDSTFVNASQAVAVFLDEQSDKVAFINTRLEGYQDTLFSHGKRAYFNGGSISGNVDFIFGAGQSLFEGVNIINRPRGKKMNSGEIQAHITAPSTSIHQAYGLVFIDCTLTREAGVPDASVSLGRPWHPTTTFSDGRYADPEAIGYAVYINTQMDAHIIEAGWASMGGTARDGTKTAIFKPEDSRFYERNSSGLGAKTLGITPTRRALNSPLNTVQIKQAVLGDWQPPAP